MFFLAPANSTVLGIPVKSFHIKLNGQFSLMWEGEISFSSIEKLQLLFLLNAFCSFVHTREKNGHSILYVQISSAFKTNKT